MKKLFATLILVLGITSCSKAQKSEFSAESLSEKLTDLSGKQIAFSDILKKHSGKTLVIEVWASWCSDCIKSMPKFKKLQAAHPEANYMFISMDKASDKWRLGIEKHQLQGNHYWVNDGMKGAFGKAIDLDWIPRYIILDKNGKIVTYRAVETDFTEMEKTLNKLKTQ